MTLVVQSQVCGGRGVPKVNNGARASWNHSTAYFQPDRAKWDEAVTEELQRENAVTAAAAGGRVHESGEEEDSNHNDDNGGDGGDAQSDGNDDDRGGGAGRGGRSGSGNISRASKLLKRGLSSSSQTDPDVRIPAGASESTRQPVTQEQRGPTTLTHRGSLHSDLPATGLGTTPRRGNLQGVWVGVARKDKRGKGQMKEEVPDTMDLLNHW
ncbi:hypothetical protein HDU93_009530 [Gonapodya sp. JEL0774]|nr:hypothetical protein HDU93_009530 [Gonapodya sp. JEL0774]